MKASPFVAERISVEQIDDATVRETMFEQQMLHGDIVAMSVNTDVVNLPECPLQHIRHHTMRALT